MESQRQAIVVHSPVTGGVVGRVDVHSAAEVGRAVDAARAAQPAWEALGARSRAAVLARWGELLWARRADLIDIIRQETGKTEGSALLESVVVDHLIAYTTRTAPRLLSRQPRKPLFPVMQRAYVDYRAHGVVGFISAWNYPLALPLLDAVPALAAGNAAVLKPSERTPLTARLAFELLHEAGMPPDAAAVVYGAGEVGAALVDTADYIAFTGSIDVGREVAARCGERLVGCSLELGGKDPLIVLADADLDLAAAAALRGAFENAGQVCLSIERVYVEAPIYDAFIDRLRDLYAGLTLGAGDGLAVHVGSMTDERELCRTEAHVADALARGARLVAGGRRRPDLGPLFYEPAILADVDHHMTVMREETFGPLLPVMRAADADEAVRLANDSVYGLSAAVFGRDLHRAQAVAARLVCGDVSINRTQMVIATPSLPMGGRRLSGLGRRGGPEGLLRFVVPQAVVVDTMLGATPSLTLVEPALYRLALLARRVRRVLPFVGP